jgi:hypothetical protein
MKQLSSTDRSLLANFRAAEAKQVFIFAKNENMALRTRLTPFSRLLLFMIIVLPLAYFGAAYYNNEDPMAKLRELMGKTSVTMPADAPPATADSCEERVKALEEENAALRKALEVMAKGSTTARDTAASNRQKWGK